MRNRVPTRGTTKDTTKDVKRSTLTQQPTIPWSSLLRQRPTLQLTQQS